MSNKKRLAIWSAVFESDNGQSIVTRELVSSIPVLDRIVFTYRSGILGALDMITMTVGLYVNFLVRRTDVVYLVMSRSTLGFLRDIPVLMSSLFGIRIVAHCHGSDVLDLLFRRRYSRLASYFYKRCDLVVPSSHLLNPLIKGGIGRVHVCENFYVGLDGSDFQPIDPIRSGLVVIWNSNILASKGFFEVTKAIENLIDRGKKVTFIVLGLAMSDSEMRRDEVLEEIEKLHSSYWFNYLGHVSPAEAASYVSKSDVVCLPSRYSSECQPLAIIQAMCLGKALVLADSPALRATAGEYPASFVDSRDQHQIADALIELPFGADIDAGREKMALLATERFSKMKFIATMSRILKLTN